MLRDDLEGWDRVGGGREVQDGGAHVRLWLMHVDIWQKPRQYCETVILQLKMAAVQSLNHVQLSATCVL